MEPKKITIPQKKITIANKKSESAEQTERTERTKPCPFCGEEIKAVAVKCKHCGTVLDPSALPPQRSVGIYIVLWLFGGVLGAHRAYLGNVIGGLIIIMYEVTILLMHVAKWELGPIVLTPMLGALLLADLGRLNYKSFKISNLIEFCAYLVLFALVYFVHG